LAPKIIGIIRARRLTQVQAAELLNVDQPKISAFPLYLYVCELIAVS
jgi:predicted XRE-type DNA-binding protein